ncbi:MAG: THUMP domain-containing protein [Thermoplasmatota archaeon]
MSTAPADWSTFLVRYGEIGIKGPAVRAYWERKLASNLEEQLAVRKVEGTIENERGRLFLRARDASASRDALAHTFGVVSSSLAEELPSGIEEIAAHVARATRLPAGVSFAVRARRTGQQPYTSMELAKRVGSAVYNANPGVRVDLDAPDVELFLEARPGRCFFFRDASPGPGGLPLGTQGRVAIWMDSERAALAAWLMMKRGTTPILLLPNEEGARAAKRLLAWAPRLRGVAFALPREANRATELALADALAARKRALAIVFADGVEGATSLAALDRASHRPVFRPLLAFTDEKALELVAASAGLVAEDERVAKSGEPDEAARVAALESAHDWELKA